MKLSSKIAFSTYACGSVTENLESSILPAGSGSSLYVAAGYAYLSASDRPSHIHLLSHARQLSPLSDDLPLYQIHK